MTRDPAQPCTWVAADELAEADPTPGMSRRVALHRDRMWSGTVDTEPHATSGWHHHGDYETTLFVLSGRMRMESGPGGTHVVEAGPGDFLRVPAGAVHRESNPGDEPGRAVIVRCGTGQPTVNVDGPAADVRHRPDRSPMSTMLTLDDGRDLELEVTGPDGGDVLLFIHGTPGASHQLGQLARAVHTRGHRLVTWSRAGYGASSRRPGRDVASETADVTAVLDHLGIESCVVAGWSGGGPHALACGALLADRVRAVTTIAGVAPYDADGLDFLAGMGEDNLEEFGAALQGEEPLRAWLTAARAELVDITGPEVAASLETLISEGDRASLTGEFADYLATEFRQAVSAGVDGWLDDDLAFVRPWGFDLGEIAVPTHLWQGGEDLMVPFSHGQWLRARIPGATAHLEAGSGHLDILLGHLDTWVEELLVAGGR